MLLLIAIGYSFLKGLKIQAILTRKEISTLSTEDDYDSEDYGSDDYGDDYDSEDSDDEDEEEDLEETD